jgi:hypothetical protein
MKNNLYSLFAGLLLSLACALTTQAQTIRRCNNTGVTGTNIYATLQAAHDAAASGDIIYLEPSSISYGDLICVRPLTIIGTGYFLAQNLGLQLDLREAIVGIVRFRNGSAGSRITGCTIISVNITTSNVTVERNNITSQCFVGYDNQTGGYATVNNILIRQNYFSSSTLYLYTANTTVSNVIISNNIIVGSIASSGFTGLNSILITNNVIGDLAGTSQFTLDVDNAVIKNNILTYTGTGNNFTPRNNAYSNNISGNAEFGTANGNQQNISPANIFVGGTASTDGAFQLRAGSPATGKGEGGVDIGAFGGVTSYRIAGIPNVPTIYQYNQSVTGNTLNATISTRSNN